MGLTKVPAFADEDEYYVPGLHEAIVNEDLFHRVQEILKKIGDKNYIRAPKSKKREELPLRGVLVCPDCNRNLTGSRSRSRNGNYYFYYHCQNDCKIRFNALDMDKKLFAHLKSLTIPSEVCDLYMAILEDTFKTNERDRKNR